jgi:hypothetical protein
MQEDIPAFSGLGNKREPDLVTRKDPDIYRIAFFHCLLLAAMIYGDLELEPYT